MLRALLIMIAITSARCYILFVEIWAALLSVSHRLADHAILCPYHWMSRCLLALWHILEQSCQPLTLCM